MFEVKELLNPVSSSQIFGEDISFSREIDTIMEARRFDDSSLDQGEWVAEVKTADWPFVIEQCSSLIISKSKDLRLAVWLTEASAKIYQFSGLAEGYLLLAGFCDHFWEGMYPLADDGDQEQRVGNLHWILTRSLQLVKEIPVTEGQGTAYSIMDFEIARARAANGEKNSSSDNRSEDGLKLADFETARRKSSRGFYEKLLDDAQHCQSALLQMEQSVDARLGIDGPGFSAAKDAIENVLKTIARFAQESGIKTDKANQNQEITKTQGDLSDMSQQVVNNSLNGAIQTRAQALAQLRTVADFFRRTEPHSPVAYLADKAAHWGEMPLHTWLSTVIKDPASLSHVEELLGLKLPPDTQ
jgi:type VI secretion system protein ImpA